MHKRSSAILRATLLAVIVGIATPGLAAPPEGKGGGKDKGGEVCEEGLFSPVILLAGSGATTSNEGPFQMKEDGSCLEAISVFGDLTHNGGPGEPRYFLVAEQQLDLSYELDVYSEDGVWLSRLTRDVPRNIHHLPRWSNDGRQVTYAGSLYNPNSEEVEAGIFVGNVVFDNDGVPVSLENERLVVARGNDYLIPFLSWSWDDTRIAYGVSVKAFSEIYVVDLSNPLTPYEVHIEGGGEVHTPNFSPVDDRLAFRQRTSLSGCVDIYVVDLPRGYDGVTALPATQVTKPKNLSRVCPSGVPEWEPNGDYFAFTDGTHLGQIHKIRSDGTGKSVKLTDNRKQEQGYFVIGWRD